MGPKKNALTASTPAVAYPSATFAGISDNSVPSTINESSFVLGNVTEVVLKQQAVLKVSTLDLIYKAIETVGVPRKGASYMAIQKWIVNNKEDVEINRLRVNMKKAFVKALASGVLKRPAASKNVTGLKGYFLINKEVNMQKITSTKPAAALKGKAKASKIPKPKTETDPKPKAAVKSKSDTDEAASAKPKTKAGKTKSDTDEAASAKPKTKAGKAKVDAEKAVSSKPKTKAVKSKSDTDEAASAKTKTKAGKTKSEEAAIAKPKTKAGKTKSEEAAIAKPKTKAVKSKSDTEEESSAKPKNKAVKSKSDTEEENSAKPKNKAGKSKSDTEEEISAKPKNKAAKSKSDTEETSIAEIKAGKSKADTESGSSGKVKAAVKSKAGKGGPKTKATAEDGSLDCEDLPIPKQKTVPSRVEGIKVPIEELNSVQIPKKVAKNASKPTKNVKISAKEPRSKKLYTSRVNPATNMSRKDLSDTELNIKPDNRKSLKSYSSDTEVEVTKRKKGTKNTKIAVAKKIKEVGPSKPNAKKQVATDETF